MLCMRSQLARAANLGGRPLMGARASSSTGLFSQLLSHPFVRRMRNSLRNPRLGLRSGRTFVGADELGNKYYVSVAPIRTHGGSAAKEVREVVFAGGSDPSEYDPNLVPPEWTRWLSKQRLDAPPAVGAVEQSEPGRPAVATIPNKS